MLYSTSGVDRAEDAEVVFQVSSDSPGAKLRPSSVSELGTSRDHLVSGGRVAFDRLFVGSFGQQFRALKEDLLAAYICTASNMIQHLDTTRPGLMADFLDCYGKDAISTSGLLGTLTGWFPELQRLSPRFGKYTKLKIEESKSRFDETYQQLQSLCSCSQCIATDGPLDAEVCTVVLAEFIVSLGLRIIQRMTVSPKLCPKKGGLTALYKRHRDNRTPKAVGTTPSDHFIDTMATKFAPLVEMLRSGTLLFANSISPEIEMQPAIMGITHAGLCVFMTGIKGSVTMDDKKTRKETWTTNISVSPGWMCLFGHETRMQVYEKMYSELNFEDQWKAMIMGKEQMQLMKWRGRTMLSTVAATGSDEQRKLVNEGWASVD